jgi:ferredoxin
MKITVDLDICQGNAVCVQRAPGIFELGADEKVVVLVAEPSEDRREDVRLAAAVCPTQAILIEES